MKQCNSILALFAAFIMCQLPIQASWLARRPGQSQADAEAEYKRTMPSSSAYGRMSEAERERHDDEFEDYCRKIASDAAEKKEKEAARVKALEDKIKELEAQLAKTSEK